MSQADLIQEEMNPSQTHVRLLFCHNCSSVDQLPDYDGPPQYDHYLEYRVSQHQSNGTPHKGLLVRVQDKPDVINATIDELENQIATVAGQGAGLGQKMYDLRDNFKAEAMTCWKKHNRTKNCGEFRHDKMRLWIDTKAERKEEGMSTRREDRPNIWLCDHCPMASIVQQRQNAAGGAYDTTL